MADHVFQALSDSGRMMSSTSPKKEMLTVQLFGGPRLFRGDEEIPLSPYQAALLAIAFRGDKTALRRAEALSLLWPDEESATARRRLSQLLYSLRQKTGEPGALEPWKEEIRVPLSGVSTDLTEFMAALGNGSFLACLALLKKGLAPRTAGLVNRKHTDWIAAKEAELRQTLLRQAGRTWHARAVEEDWEGALAAAATLLEMAPEDETHLQQFMEAKAKSGSPRGSREAFMDYSARMKGTPWTPTERTNALLEAASSSATHSLVREAKRGTPEPPLLGRDQERNLLRRALKETLRKELRGVLVSGEAGIGKTRLIREALQSLPFDGQRVFSSESAELEKIIPLNPLIEVFKGPEVGKVLRQLEEPWRTVLFGVMPSHYLGKGLIPEAPHIQPGSVPRRLFEAFHQLLLRLVKDGPLVLVLEDLQWADETTLSVLEFLIRRWDHGNLQFLASTRTEEVRRNPVLGRFLENLSHHAGFLEIPLGDLDPPECEALIRNLATRPLENDNISQLRSLAGGNPYFLIELTLEYLAGRLAPVETPQDFVPIPLSIRQVLDRRLSQLSPDAERVLGSLAVHSRPLEIQGIARIAHLSVPNCLSGLDQLDEYRLVTHRGAEVIISHELVRHTVYQSLTESRRTWLHDRIARHILRTRKTAPPDELAVHFHLAGASKEAHQFAIESADRAEASGAIPEALRFLRIAREHSSDPEAVADLIGRMGHLHYLYRNLEEAAPLLELAAQRFRRQGRQDRALDAEVERIDCSATTGKHFRRDCLEDLQRVKEEAKAADLWGVFHDALDVEAHQLDREGDLDGVRSVLGQAEENAEKGTQKARCKARAMVALNIYFGSPKKGLDAARDAVRIALSTSDSKLILHALNRLILVLHYQGRLHTLEGRQALSEAEARLGTCGDLILKFHVKQNPAVWHLEIGELDTARTALLALEDLVGGTQARDAQAMLQLNLGELGLVSHDFDLAKAAYGAAEKLITPYSPHYFQTLATAGQGLFSLQTGDLPEARRREEDLPVFPDFWTYDPTIVTTFKARMLLKKQDTVRAMALLDQTRARIRRRMIPAWLRLTSEEAKIFRRLRPEVALVLARAGLAMAEDLGLKEPALQLRRLTASLV